MAYVSVPKDLTKVKSKVLLNLTKRQLLCFGGGALIGVPLFFILKNALGSSTATICMMLVLVPSMLFGLYERNGQPLEKVLKQMILVCFIRPKTRPYRTRNIYDSLRRQDQLNKEVKEILSKRKPRKGEPGKAGGKRKLTKPEKKAIRAAIERAKKAEKSGMSAQDTIPYRCMYPDGVCRVTDRTWAKTIQYDDITYQLAEDEDKQTIFNGWCGFLDYFDPSVRFQLTFVTQNTSEERIAATIDIPNAGDGFDRIRAEYTKMLRNQGAKGNNGLSRVKYITFSIEEKDPKEAKSRLESIERDLVNNFKRLGVSARGLSGEEYLEVMFRMMNMDTLRPFQFSWDWLAASGLSTKDYIAPSSLEFRTGRMFRMGKKYCQASFLQILASELEDRVLTQFLEMSSNLIFTMHIQALDRTQAIKNVKRKLTDLDRTKIDEQKKAVRSGYDMDIISPDLLIYGNEAKQLLQALQKKNERFFLVTFILVNIADSKRALRNSVMQASGIAQRNNCALMPLDFLQEEAFRSCLPLACNKVPITRGLTTSSTAIFVPFTTQELFQTGSEALYYGLNAMSNNLIMVDRKLLKNPNGLILGTPGSGKSFAAKREIANAILVCKGDDVIICDPEAEYAPLVLHFNGQVIRISPTSGDYVNPLDINLNYADDDNPVTLKTEFILSLCELIIGRREGLLPVERTVIDRCVRHIYQRYLNDPKPENMPILEDLYNSLREQEEPEGQYVATALEIYVHGSLKVFNHRTNVDTGNRIVCYDIKQLGKQLKKIGMLVVEDQIWNRVTINRAARKTTRVYYDEFHLLLKDEQTASFSVEIWKRFRKWGGIPTGITQNVKDLLASREIENIFENSDFVYLLNQAGGDREILAQQLNISEHQLSYVTQSNEGEGLICYGKSIIPFRDRFPKNTELYALLTTKPQEVSVS